MPKVIFAAFMAADNNLYLDSMRDLTEMKSVGSSAELDIVAQIDRRGAFAWENPDEVKQLNTQRIRILRSGLDIIEDLGETNTGDPGVLNSFASWTRSLNGNRTYLILWNHGGGVKDDAIYGKFGRQMKRPFFHGNDPLDDNLRWVLCDDTARDFLDGRELQQALSCGAVFDIVGFDACMMAMLEIAYQVRSSAAVVVGSQEVEPTSGWPYGVILNRLSQEIQATPSDVAKCIVSCYAECYRNTEKRTTLSALAADRFSSVCQHTNVLAQRVLEEYAVCELGLTRMAKNVLRFRDGDYVDLSHLAHLCKEKLQIPSVSDAADRLSESIESCVITAAHTGAGLENAHGISIYFPLQAPNPVVGTRYRELDFVRDFPAWWRLIERYCSC